MAQFSTPRGPFAELARSRCDHTCRHHLALPQSMIFGGGRDARNVRWHSQMHVSRLLPRTLLPGCGRGHRSGQDPAPLSTGELPCRTPRVDPADRGHRPDADLRRATPSLGTGHLRQALQPAGTSSSAAATSATSGIPAPEPSTARSDLDRFSAACRCSAARPRPRTSNCWSCVTRSRRQVEPTRAGSTWLSSAHHADVFDVVRWPATLAPERRLPGPAPRPSRWRSTARRRGRLASLGWCTDRETAEYEGPRTYHAGEATAAVPDGT
jgi:hypothetical protein